MKEEIKTRKYSYLGKLGFKPPFGFFTYLFSAIVLIFSILVFALNPEEHLIFYNLAFILAGAVATFASFSLWRIEKGIEGTFLLPSFFLLLGNLSYSIAEGIWLVYENVLGIEAPTFSIADFFWILGYLLFFAFLTKKVWTAYSALPLPEKAGPAMFLLLSIIVGYFSVISRLFALPDWDLLSKIIGATYIFGDFILIGGIAVLIVAFSGGTFFLPNALLASGFVLFALADIFYYDLMIRNAYGPGSLWDLGWTLGYLFIAAFAVETGRILKKVLDGD